MSVDTSSSIIRSFKNFFLGTFFSRISGFLRDVSMAFFFGASPHIAAFMVAYRFANLFRRLLGDSSFQAGFVPFYESLRIENRKKSTVFYRDLFFSILFLLICVVLACEIILGVSLKTFSNPEIIHLTQIMLIGLIFICLYALNSSFLQCHRSYFLPSVSPVSFNLVWIGCIVIFRNIIADKFVYILSVAVVFALFFQYLITAFSSFKIVKKDLSIKDLFRPKIFTEDIKKLIKPIFLAILGIGAVQINSALDSIFATLAQKSGPAYLWYSIRLYQLPLALFGIAISSAILPPLTRAYKNEDLLNFKKFLNLAFIKSFALMMPCSIALIILAPSFVNLVYARGAFLAEDLINTSYCLIGYAIGLSFSTFVMIIASAFYAKKEYSYPTASAILAVLVNIILNSIFIFAFNMKSLSIAIATSLSSIFNFIILSYFLKKKFLKPFSGAIFMSFTKICLCTFLAAGLTLFIGYLMKDQSILFLLRNSVIFPKSFLAKVNSFFVLSSIYISSLFLIAYVTKTKEIVNLIRAEKASF